jgi:hypothetical protein
MRRLRRGLRRHSGITARRVSVRTAWPWQWRLAMALLLLALGYGLGYWSHTGSKKNQLEQKVQRLVLENQAMQAGVVQMERRLQVEHAAQSSLAQEMAVLQDESMRLKEDVTFYQSILAENGATGVPKLHSVKLSKGAHAGEYQYRILLVQSGRHDKMVQGSLVLLLNATQSGKSVTERIETTGQGREIRVDFKYFQRIEGTFSVPPHMEAHSVQVQFTESGGAKAKFSQTVNLPV